LRKWEQTQAQKIQHCSYRHFGGISKNRRHQENRTLKSRKIHVSSYWNILWLNVQIYYSFIGHLLNKYGDELNEKNLTSANNNNTQLCEAEGIESQQHRYREWQMVQSRLTSRKQQAMMVCTRERECSVLYLFVALKSTAT
jgi:hypothetical protein